MEDLSAILGDLLSGGDTLEQLRGVIAAAGLGQSPSSAEPADTEPAKVSTAEAAPVPEVDFSALLGMLGSMGASPRESAGGAPDLSALLGMLGGGKGTSPPPAAGGIDPALLGKLVKMLGTMNQSDRNTELLRALAPFCDDHRKKRVEEAAQIMRILKFLPLLGGEKGE